MTKLGFARSTSEAQQKEVESDLSLIRRAKNGDVKAFESIFQRYHLRIVNLAYRIVGDPDCADDIAQETFVRLYHALGQFRNEKKFFSWLYRITVNMCYDFLRREKRFRHAALDEQANSPAATEEQSPHPELIEKIYEMLNRLSTPQKTAFILRETEGLRCREIARVMDCPIGTVRSHLFHGRKKLRVLIQRHYPDLLEGI